MGDLKEVYTNGSIKYKVIKVTSSAIAFDLKTVADGLVALSRKPNYWDYQIMIGHNRRCWIKEAGEWGGDSKHKFVETPDILNSSEFRRFWVSWHSGQVRLGQGESHVPLMAYDMNHVRDMEYVTFSTAVCKSGPPAVWRFEVSPVPEEVKTQIITKGQLYWTPYRLKSRCPEQPLIGGYEKEAIYIARATHMGVKKIGKFVPSKGKAYIFNKEHVVEKFDFEILCGFDAFWTTITLHNNIFVPVHNQLIGRAMVDGHLIPGKASPKKRLCHVAYENKKVKVVRYEILTVIKPTENRVEDLCVKDIHPTCRLRLFADYVSEPESD